MLKKLESYDILIQKLKMDYFIGKNLKKIQLQEEEKDTL